MKNHGLIKFWFNKLLDWNNLISILILEFDNLRHNSDLLKHLTPDVVRVSNEMLVNNGQGDGETKWKGWAWKLLLVIFVIFKKKNFFLLKTKI